MECLFLAESVVAWDGAATLERDASYPLRLLGAVGAGGFGSVYRVDTATLPHAPGALALKRGNVGFPAEDLKLPFSEDGRTARALLRRAFLLEWEEYGQAAGANGHVPRAHAFGILTDDAGKTAYYAILMDWVEGTGFEEAANLVSRDHSGRLSAEQTMRWGRLLCEALSALHRNNVVHRDLYPSNIKVRLGDDRMTADWMYLLDLGQSTSPADVVTPSGDIQRLAQLQYGAPEMFLSPGDPFYDDRNDPTVDVWSLGALLYHLRTGEAPIPELDHYAHRPYLTPQDARGIAATKQGGVRLGDGWQEQGDDLLRRLIAECTQEVPALRPSVKAVWHLLGEALKEASGEPNGALDGEAPGEPQPADLPTPTPVCGPGQQGAHDGANESGRLTPLPNEKTPEQDASPEASVPARDERIPSFLTVDQRVEYSEALAAPGPDRAVRAAEYYALEPSLDAHRVAAAFRKIAADRGHAQSCVVYGHALFYGIDGVRSDPVGACGYLRRGLELGAQDSALARACHDLGLAYRYGLGTPRSFLDALSMFQRAASLGRADATFELALMYREGAGVPADAERSAQLMREAVRAGSQQAVDWLAAHGERVWAAAGDTPGRAEADDKGDGDSGGDGAAEATEGTEGDQMAPSFFTAEQSDEYRAAMAAAEVDRAVRAAEYYAKSSAPNGRKVATAFRRIAADRGHGPSCVAYGHAQMYGLDGVAANPQSAVRYLERGVGERPLNRSLAYGAFDLGIAYRYGLGAQRSFAKALELFGRASRLGHADATYELALMHYEGAGVKIDEERAKELMRDAARAGSHQASEWLQARGESVGKKRRGCSRVLIVLFVLLVLLAIALL